MKTERTTSLAAGALFLVATAALGAHALDPSLAGSEPLRELAGHRPAAFGAAVLYLIAAATSVGIAIALYPLLQRIGRGLALGSVVFRTIEAVFYIVAVVTLLSLQGLSEGLTAGRAADQTPAAALGDLLTGIGDHANAVAIFAFSLGSSMYYALLFRARLVPRWLSGWGAGGAVLMMVACLSAIAAGAPVTGYTLLILPILVQELVLAVWLLIRGFTPSSVAALSVSREIAGAGSR